MSEDRDQMTDRDIRAFLHNRLHGIETKLNEMQTLMVKLARVEERLSNNLDGMHRLGNRVDEQEDRISELERQVLTNSRVSRAVERVGWMFVTLVFSVFGFMTKELIDHVTERKAKDVPTEQSVILQAKDDDITGKILKGEES